MLNTRNIQLFILIFGLASTTWSSLLFAQKQPPIPLPQQEASWLFATCIGQGIPGNGQPDKIALSPCVKKNGANKVISAFYPIQGGFGRCRIGVDECSEFKNSREFIRMEEEFSCKDGLKNGAYKGSILHKNRSQNIFSARVEAHYINGNLEGESRHFSFFGKSICYRYQYKNGLLSGKAEKLTADGKVTAEAYFKNGLRHGKSTTFGPTGNIIMVETFKNGLKNGESSYFTTQGNLSDTSIYENGKEVQRATITNGERVVLNKQQIEKLQRDAEEELARLPQPHPKRYRFLPYIGLNLGYLNDDLTAEESEKRSEERVSGFTIGPQLTLPLIACQDIGCSGYVLNLGGARSHVTDKSFYHAELGPGFVVMFLSGYLGAGVRVDGERVAFQSTLFFGAILANVYVRGFRYTDKEGGGGFETGLMLSYPVFGL